MKQTDSATFARQIKNPHKTKKKQKTSENIIKSQNPRKPTLYFAPLAPNIV